MAPTKEMTQTRDLAEMWPASVQHHIAMRSGGTQKTMPSLVESTRKKKCGASFALIRVVVTATVQRRSRAMCASKRPYVIAFGLRRGDSRKSSSVDRSRQNGTDTDHCFCAESINVGNWRELA